MADNTLVVVADEQHIRITFNNKVFTKNFSSNEVQDPDNLAEDLFSFIKSNYNNDNIQVEASGTYHYPQGNIHNIKSAKMTYSSRSSNYNSSIVIPVYNKTKFQFTMNKYKAGAASFIFNGWGNCTEVAATIRFRG